MLAAAGQPRLAVEPTSSSLEAHQKRLKLREAGQKKFAEWKEARRLNQAAASAASSPACFALTSSSQQPNSTAGPGIADSARLAGTLGPATSPSVHQHQLQQVSPGTPTTHTKASQPLPAMSDTSQQPLAAQASPEASPGGGSGDTRDPLVDMLLVQVEALMREKATLQQHNLALKRENEQLQELVGYLSEQQHTTEQTSPRWDPSSQEASGGWEEHEQAIWHSSQQFHPEAASPSPAQAYGGDHSEGPQRGVKGDASLPHSSSAYALVNGHGGIALVSLTDPPAHAEPSSNGSGTIARIDRPGNTGSSHASSSEEEYCLVDG